MLNNKRWRSWLKMLIPVVGGNILYYSFIHSFPDALQHQPFQLDWGLLADFWICLLGWGLYDLTERIISKWQRKH
jgi:hypothetical protein